MTDFKEAMTKILSLIERKKRNETKQETFPPKKPAGSQPHRKPIFATFPSTYENPALTKDKNFKAKKTGLHHNLPKKNKLSAFQNQKSTFKKSRNTLQYRICHNKIKCNAESGK